MVEVLIAETISEYLAGTKREGARVGDICADWAKAEDAKAKPKIINSKDRRYVFILKASIRQSTANYVKPIFGNL